MLNEKWSQNIKDIYDVLNTKWSEQIKELYDDDDG